MRPTYFKFYEGKSGLEIESLFPEDFDQVARRMAKDDIYYEKYLRYDFGENRLKLKFSKICFKLPGFLTKLVFKNRSKKKSFAEW